VTSVRFRFELVKRDVSMVVAQPSVTMGCGSIQSNERIDMERSCVRKSWLMPTFYKVTRADGTDFRTGSFQYRAGKTLEQTNCDPGENGPCGAGLHVSRTLIKTCLFGDRSIDRGRWRWWEVEVAERDIIAQDADKMRVSKLYVVREIARTDIFGDLKKRAAIVRKISASFKEIPWLRPLRRISDKKIKTLVNEWRTGLQQHGSRELASAVRIVRTADAAAAAAAAADADAAADAAAAAAKIKRWWLYGHWYIRPYWVLRRFAWFELIRKSGQANPFESLVKLYRFGCLPIGYCCGENGPEFVVYVPESSAVKSPSRSKRKRRS